MLVIGHRGAAGHAPENTIASIGCAIAMGVDHIEIDVQPTKDGRLVVFHDRTMRRLTGLHGYVQDYTFLELKEKANIFNKHKIPSFEEVCDLVAKSNVKQIDPTVKTIALIEGVPVSIKNIVHNSQCNYLGLGIESLDKQQIQEARSEGCGVIVWTVDEADELPLLCELGIDGIVSNFPDKIMKSLSDTELSKQNHLGGYQ